MTTIIPAGLILAMLLCSCANIGAPSGGPVDKDGPVIITVEPENETVQVPLNARIILTVDEWFDNESFIDAFFISPEPAGKINFKFGLKSISVSFKKGLVPEQTYVVTVGTGFKDLNRNNMKESYTFAFSSGQRINYGLIEGAIVSGKAGFIVGLYPVEGEFDPAVQRAKYLTQSGDEGKFTLNYLSPGTYRMVVFGDKNGDRMYNAEEEELGLAWSDFTVSEDTTSGVYIKTVMHPPAPAGINSIAARDNNALEIYLDRPLKKLPRANDFFIMDTTSGESLAISLLYRHPADSARLVLYTGDQETVEYSLIVDGGEDFWDNALTDTGFFKGVMEADTLPPALISFKAQKDSIWGQIGLTFSEAVESKSLFRGFYRGDSLLNLSYREVISVSPAAFEIKSKVFTQLDTVDFHLEVLRDISGNPGPDTAVSIPLTVADTSGKTGQYGKLSGEISYSEKCGSVLMAWAGGKEVSSLHLASPGNFAFEQIAAGYYTFQAFLDANGDGRYNYGKLKPYIPAERYTVAEEDTFRVRARWETTGLVIKF